MTGEDAVFVVGIGRSGTSALRTALHRLPAFRAVRERSPETRVFAQPRHIERILEERGRRLFRYMLRDEDEARRLLETLSEMRLPGGRWRRRWSRRTRDPLRAWRLAGHDHRVRIFFHHAQRARRAPRILEKTPHHWQHMDVMQATFPEARIVMCIRHPVDVMSSLRKRHARESARGRRPEKLRWLEVDAESMVDRYRPVARALLAQRDALPHRRHLLRYEDLTADPALRLERLCDFLGEPFDAEALLGSVTEDRDPHGSPVKGSRIAANLKRWNEWVTEEEALTVETALAPEIDALEYRRYTA